MNTPFFQSFLAPYLHQFVQYKRALNRKYLNDAHTLRLFDRYLCTHNIADWPAIDSAVVDDFLVSRPKVGPKRYNLILYAVRRFFAFAIMQQWTQRSPVTASPRRITGSRIPYLFDLDTARRLMVEARKLPERSRAPYRGLVYETIFALLYGLGLRVTKTRVQIRIADLAIGRGGVVSEETRVAAPITIGEADIELPDLLTDLQDKTQLTRRSLVRILTASNRLDDFKRNPQQFIELADESINRTKRLALVDGIR
ncbi:MAG: hypothetical protein WBE76_09245 [Terracidiphilus sp.]